VTQLAVGGRSEDVIERAAIHNGQERSAPYEGRIRRQDPSLPLTGSGLQRTAGLYSGVTKCHPLGSQAGRASQDRTQSSGGGASLCAKKDVQPASHIDFAPSDIAKV